MWSWWQLGKWQILQYCLFAGNSLGKWDELSSRDTCLSPLILEEILAARTPVRAVWVYQPRHSMCIHWVGYFVSHRSQALFLASFIDSCIISFALPVEVPSFPATPAFEVAHQSLLCVKPDFFFPNLGMMRKPLNTKSSCNLNTQLYVQFK